MKNSILLEILRTFDAKEVKEFQFFASSPFFNKNKNVIKLETMLHKEYPEFNIDKITKEVLYKKIYPGKKYNDENMKTIIFLLTRLAEKYIAYVKFREDPFEEKSKLLVSFDKRKLDKHFHRLEKQITEELGKTQGTDLTLINNKITFEKARGTFYTERNDEQKIYEIELKYAELMISSFLIEILRQVNLLARIKFLGFKLEYDFATEFISMFDLERFLKVLKANSLNNVNLLEIYHKMYLTLDESAAFEDYLIFKDSFLIHKDSLGKNEQYIITTLMVNVLFYKHLKDRAKYDKELFEAFKILISLYEYSGDKYLRAVVYSNVLRLGVQFREFEWTEKYIEEYSKKLEPDHRDNMFFYSNAFLSFSKGQFEKCLQYAAKVNFNTFQMKYYLRDLQLCAHYELSHFESALSLIDAYKHFIKKEKNYSPELKQGYLNFIGYTLELIKIKLGSESKDIDDLRNRIKISHTMRQQWLLDKVSELEASNTRPYS